MARSGQTMDPSAGRAALEPVFADTDFKMGYLTKQNAVWAALGVNLGKRFSPVDQVSKRGPG